MRFFFSSIYRFVLKCVLGDEVEKHWFAARTRISFTSGYYIFNTRVYNVRLPDHRTTIIFLSVICLLLHKYIELNEFDSKQERKKNRITFHLHGEYKEYYYYRDRFTVI